ncbi:hypothetical protein HNQ71_005655 [Mesorhizobium sangaii]|uniref:Uncharacterized protein n=1 Tax=Mesorhizobium sangaii TaxID=505389 RepID=A0A841PH74_9HYPH|nr:hypothetical protein [Mesorhizobium sangaii]
MAGRPTHTHFDLSLTTRARHATGVCCAPPGLPALRYGSLAFGRSDPSKGPLDLLIRPKADQVFTVRRSKSQIVGFSSAARTTPHPTVS